jgi:hypothetical protein
MPNMMTAFAGICPSVGVGLQLDDLTPTVQCRVINDYVVCSPEVRSVAESHRQQYPRNPH